MESLGDLYVQIQVVTTKLEQGLNWAKEKSIQAVQGIQNTFDNLRFKNDEVISGFDGINLSSNELKARLIDLKGQLQSLTSQFGVLEQTLAGSISREGDQYRRLQAEIQATKEKLVEMQSEETATGNGFGFMGNMIERIMIRMAVFMAIREVFSLIKDAVKDFSDQQEASERLAYSLGKVSTGLSDTAKAMEQKSRFSRADITDSQAEFAEYSKSENIINSLTQATIDLAAAKGMKLTQATQQVSEAISGTGTQLEKYGIQTKGSADSTQRLDSIIKGISERFGGSASDDVNTFSGSMASASSQMKEQGEVLGEQLAPAIKAVVQWWLEMTQKSEAFRGAGTIMVGSLKVIASALMIVVGAAKDVIDVLGIMVASVISVSRLDFSGAWNIIKNGFTTMNKQDTETLTKIGQLWVGKEPTPQPKNSAGNATPPIDKKAIAEAKKLTEDFYKSLDESSTAYYGYQKKKIDEEYQKYSKVIKDKSVLDGWYVRELEKLDDKQKKSSDAKIDKQLEGIKQEQEYLTLTKQDTSFLIQAAIDRVNTLLNENMTLEERNKLLKERKELEDSLKENGTNIVDLDGIKAFKPSMTPIDDKTVSSLRTQSNAGIRSLDDADILAKKWRDDNKNIADITQSTIRTISSDWGSGIIGWIMKGESFTTSMINAFSNMATTIIEKITEIGAQWALLQAAEGIFDSASGGFGGFIINALGGSSNRIATTGNSTHFDASPVSKAAATASQNNTSLLNEMRATTQAVKAMNLNMMKKGNSDSDNLNINVRGQLKGSDLALVTNKANKVKNRIS